MKKNQSKCLIFSIFDINVRFVEYFYGMDILVLLICIYALHVFILALVGKLFVKKQQIIFRVLFVLLQHLLTL